MNEVLFSPKSVTNISPPFIIEWITFPSQHDPKNPLKPLVVVFSKILIFIPDKPRVSLRLGKSLDPDNLRTGNDVYFECDVKSNPIPHKLVWLHKVSELKLSTSTPIYINKVAVCLFVCLEHFPLALS